jgi:protein-disulfide isomerase
MTTNKSEARRVGIWTITLVIIGLVIYGAIQLVPTNPSTNNSTGSIPDKMADDHISGSGPVTLVEYSDLQCPACKRYYPILKQIQLEMGSEVTVIYRHFPLVTIHQNARIAAQATEAASRQGKFWEMHDKLFEGQESWAEDRNPELIFEQYAKDLSLNVEQFKADLNSSEVRQRVERDIQDGNSAGINSTPTFYINGKSVSNPRNYEDFRALIEAAKPTT